MGSDYVVKAESSRMGLVTLYYISDARKLPGPLVTAKQDSHQTPTQSVGAMTLASQPPELEERNLCCL